MQNSESLSIPLPFYATQIIANHEILILLNTPLVYNLFCMYIVQPFQPFPGSFVEPVTSIFVLIGGYFKEILSLTKMGIV
jgi:hypothetical protein